MLAKHCSSSRRVCPALESRAGLARARSRECPRHNGGATHSISLRACPKLAESTGSILCIVVLCVLFACSVAIAQQSDYNRQARRILDETGVRGGLIIHVGCGNGKLTAALRAGEGYLVHGLDSNDKNVSEARRYIESLGFYGDVAVDKFDGRRLPYTSNLAKLIVVKDIDDLPQAEMMRVLAPGGVAYVNNNGKWIKNIKIRPETIDNWTHYLHDASGNAVAADSQVGPPKHIRWVAGPRWSRSHEFNPSMNGLVSAGGRMFYIFDEGIAGLPDLRFPSRWALYARDAFSGKLLWRREVPKWGYRQWNTRGMWSAPLTLNRRVVTDGERVCVTLGYDAPVTVLDAATGRTIRTVANSQGTDEMILSDGILLLCVRDKLSVALPPKKKPNRRRNPHEYNIGAPGPTAIVAVNAQTGRELWRNESEPVTVLTLAAHDGAVCYHSENKIVCLDLKNGEHRWSAPAKRFGGSRHSGGTLVIHDNVVLFTSGEGLKAFSAKNGKVLWTGPRVSGPGVTHPPDLFVADGLVWGGYNAGIHHKDRTAFWREGRNLQNGKVVRSVAVANLISTMHHFRCYRSKATNDYLMLTKRGVEFVDLQGEGHMRHDWLRAMCHYGFMPCNGLLYVPPHHCFCYPGVKMTGFLALASDIRGRDSEPSNPLEWGTAYGKVATPDNSSDEWPTYRKDSQRSGYTKTEVPTKLKVRWQSDPGGKVTPPVLAGGLLYISRVDVHRVLCLNADNGETVWTFTAGARVDSPPTVYDGLVLFGCRDGWVYCLRASDGELVWRFRAAPYDERIVAFDQVESAWPAPGSVLMLDGVAYVAAGRSSFLDGGVYLYGLKPQTGEMLYKKTVEGPWPDVHKEIGRPFDMEGTKSDILVTDGKHIFLYQMVFDKELNDVTGPRASNLGDRLCGRHLIATGGFLEDVWYDRTFWTYSNRWPGFYYANDAPKAGQILVFDDDTTYGLHVFTERLRLSPAFTPGGKGYELFADDNDNEPILKKNSINREKGPGFSRAEPPKWSKQIPICALAMVLADDKLFMAGPPDIMPEDDPYASFEGRLGAELWVVSAKNGEKLAEYTLETMPAFDGMAAARGRIYISMKDGSVLCMARR